MSILDQYAGFNGANTPGLSPVYGPAPAQTQKINPVNGQPYGPGWDSPPPPVPVVGYNPSGDQGGPFTQLQGSVGSNNYYAPVPFNPGDFGGLNAPGYIDFGSGYNPAPGSPGNNDYRYYGNYGEALGASDPGGKQISYGSAQNNQLTPQQSAPTINGNYEGTYAQQAAAGLGTANPNYVPGSTYDPNTGMSSWITPGLNGSAGTPSSEYGNTTNQISPYTPTTEPGYKAPQYSQPSAPSSTQPYSNPTGFGFWNNGSTDSLGGVFSNNTPGQSSAFYQNEPTSLTQGNPTQNLGQLTPYNPGIQALQKSRSQN